MDELFEKASVENDPGKRKKMFFEIQELVAKDIPMIYFFDYQTPSTYHKYFSGLPMGPSYWGENYGSVWWKGGSAK